jgi:tetratricopeptide (TPR) repeat protein
MHAGDAHFGDFSSRARARILFPFVMALVFALPAIGLVGCQETISKKPDDLVADGWAYFRVGDYEHAVKAYDQALQTCGSDVAVHQNALYGLATVWNLQRPNFDHPLAEKLYNEAYALAPESDTAAWTLLALARMKHLVPPNEDKALDDLEKVHPDYPPIRAAYQKVIDKFPEHRAGQEAFLYLESTYVTTLDADEAKQAVKAIGDYLAKHPKSDFESALYLLKGSAHYTLAQFAEHLACEIKALETRPIDPSNPNQDYAQPYYEVACVAEFEVGDLATARKYYQKIIDEYPVDIRGAAARAGIRRIGRVEALARAGKPIANPDNAPYTYVVPGSTPAATSTVGMPAVQSTQGGGSK